MDPVTIVALATKLIDLGNLALEASKIGDQEKAVEYLNQARDLWKEGSDAIDQALKDRDNAG